MNAPTGPASRTGTVGGDHTRHDDAMLAAPAPRPIVDRIVTGSITLGAWVAWLIPWPIWAVLTTLGGVIGMLTPTRKNVLANISHAYMGNPPRGIAAWWMGCRQISTHLDTVVMLLRSGTTRAQRSGTLTYRNAEHVLPYIGKRGIVVVSPHCGPYPSLGFRSRPWLKQQGFDGELLVVARLFRPFRSGALMDWFVSIFARAGTTIVPIDTPPRTLALRLRRTLANNGIVVLLIDEPTTYRSVLVPLFDDEILMPTGPVRLAHLTGSIIVPCVARYEAFRHMSVDVGPIIEPEPDPKATLTRVAKALEPMIRANVAQWTMLTSIWKKGTTVATDDAGSTDASSTGEPAAEVAIGAERASHPGNRPASGAAPPSPAPRAPEIATTPTPAIDPDALGYGSADLHLHTPGSDGLVTVDEWRAEAARRGIDVIAITDHDHLDTIRAWMERQKSAPSPGAGSDVTVIPGVEITARGRLVHVVVLFSGEIPDQIPKPGTRLPDVIRWARSIPGTFVVLVHPHPVIWRRQLAGLARLGLLPDAVETRYPMVGGKTAAIEAETARLGLANLGASDAHLHPSYLGRNHTRFPGRTSDDLFAAIRDRKTISVSAHQPDRLPRSTGTYQSLSSWMLPLRWIPGIRTANVRLLHRARRSAGLGELPPTD